MKTLVVYGGRFQPFHKGHKASYDSLVAQFGAGNVYVASANKVTGPKDPFAWSEKKKLAQMTGVPADKFVAPKSVYNAELIKAVIPYNPKDTVLIVALSQKDGDRLISKDTDAEGYAIKKDGSRAVIQWLKDNPEPVAAGHIYLTVTPTVEFTLAGSNVTGATEIRDMYAKADEADRTQILKDLYNKKPSQQLKKLFDKRLSTVIESYLREFKEFVGKFIC